MGSEARPVTIRRAHATDAETVARIHVASWNVAYRGIMPDDVIARTDVAYRTSFWKARLADSMWPIFVMEDAGRPIAFCHLIATAEPSVGEITSIHVLPELRGQGHGRRLLAHAFEEFRRRGFTQVTLWVLAENAKARAFYERQGFALDGGTKTYPGTRVPEVRYRIRLSNPPYGE